MQRPCPSVVIFKRIFTVQSSVSPVFADRGLRCEGGFWSCFVKFSLEEVFFFFFFFCTDV